MYEVLRDISRYRYMHAYPLKKVTIGVRAMIATELGEGASRPAQRFKRLDRILDKLRRYPHMRLSQMEDIGGCRAVFDSLAQVERVGARVQRRWPHARVDDYIAAPKPDGYRSLHIIERRDGRLIEVQLRTTMQHMWAEAIEAFSGRGFNLKDGKGPDDLRRYFAMAADRLERMDLGRPLDPDLEEEFATLRERVLHYFIPKGR